jgi:hypothetical protein
MHFVSTYQEEALLLVDLGQECLKVVLQRVVRLQEVQLQEVQLQEVQLQEVRLQEVG